jgi:hypothetical protein
MTEHREPALMREPDGHVHRICGKCAEHLTKLGLLVPDALGILERAPGVTTEQLKDAGMAHHIATEPSELEIELTMVLGKIVKEAFGVAAKALLEVCDKQKINRQFGRSAICIEACLLAAHMHVGDRDEFIEKAALAFDQAEINIQSRK